MAQEANVLMGLSVKAMIFFEGKLLLLQKNDTEGLHHWEFPGGGLQFTEDFETGLRREVKEETGIDIAGQNLTLIDCQESVLFEIFPQFRYKYAPDVTHNREHWFLLGLPDEQTPQLTEHLAFQWVSVKEAIAMTKSPNNATAIAKYLQK